MGKNIYKLKIELEDIKPLIWRRVLVDSDMDLSDLQLVIEAVMEWDGSHFHQFEYKGYYFSDPAFELENVADSSQTTLSELLTKPKDKLSYTYDFGDDWGHIITLEEILPYDESETLPICIEASNASPPEDCGGPWGYMDMLEIIKNPNHTDFDATIEWLGEDFDSTAFDIDEINEALNGLIDEYDEDDEDSYFALDPKDQLDHKRSFYQFLETFHPGLNHLNESQLHTLVEEGANYVYTAMGATRMATSYVIAMKMLEDGINPEQIYKYTGISV
jgi:hypothetical protein